MLLKAGIFALFSFTVYRYWQLSISMGVNRLGYIHRPGNCILVEPVRLGAEDIALTDDGLALVSSGLKPHVCEDHVGDPKSHSHPGRIYVFDVNHPSVGAIEGALPKELGEDFNPHGISLWQDRDSGELRLFVVNHRKNVGEVVEILRFDRDAVSFSLIKSVRNDLFTSLNDVAAVGPESFYAVNDGYFMGCTRIAEILLGLPLSGVVFYDGVRGRATSVIGGMADCNSAAISRDGTFLYLTQLSEQTLNVYRRRGGDGSLEFVRAIHTGVAIDNVFEDPTTGDLWLGAQPSLQLLANHMDDLSNKAPSQVIQMRPTGHRDDPFSSYELYSPFGDDGTLISGSTVAVRYGRKLLIGSAMHKMVICDLGHWDTP